MGTTACTPAAARASAIRHFAASEDAIGPGDGRNVRSASRGQVKRQVGSVERRGERGRDAARESGDTVMLTKLRQPSRTN